MPSGKRTKDSQIAVANGIIAYNFVIKNGDTQSKLSDDCEVDGV
jgi:hypothetical protein